MSTDREQLTNPQHRIPGISLTPVSGGPETPLRARGRKSPVLVLVHGLSCAECGDYLRELSARKSELEEWDGRVLVITPDATAPDEAAVTREELGLPVLSDPDARVAGAMSIDLPASVVADQWGEIHETREAGAEHHFPTPAELIGSVRYLAVQCPECQGEAF